MQVKSNFSNQNITLSPTSSPCICTVAVATSGHLPGHELVTVRGLDHRTEDYSQSPATQSQTRSLLNSSKQDNPAVVINNRTTKPKIKGPLDRDKSCSQVGATHEALLHLPCFSHSRLMRLEATITFIGHNT